MDRKFKRADIDDLAFLEKTEQACFPKFQQTSRRMLRLGITSLFQDVLICRIKIKNQWTDVGSLVLHLHKHTLRLYSIAVLPEYRGMNLGKMMITYCLDLARGKGYEKVSLEAYAGDEPLIAWYESFGFKITEHLPDYYEKGKDAVKMNYQLHVVKEKTTRENIVVVDSVRNFRPDIENVKVVSAKKYISDQKYQELKNARVFNLCNSYRYQSMGYYVSLLASARDHRVIPSVATIGDYRNISIIKSISTEVDDLIQKSLNGLEQTRLSIVMYFGHTIDEKYKLLASRLYKLFETPILQISFTKSDKWYIQKVTPMGINKLDDGDKEQLYEFMQQFFARKRFAIPRLKNYKYDLAILVNPDEKNPPSCPRALEKFKAVADKRGFYTEFITREDLNRLSEFDALFIRETTNVNNYTYSFSRMAYSEGLVVIDDPWSILRCSNKIYLYERMALNKIKMPYSKVISKWGFRSHEMAGLNFPMVLKQPDGSFSLGVTKVENHDEMNERLKELFKNSELIVAQSFMPSEYDWRIGILDHQVLFGCKYFMAKGHWQIYNWKGKGADQEGNFETVPLHLIPPKIIKTALKASSLIGDGLYGVDLKEVNGEVYLIEVNDNPNIDAGVEDKLLKDDLYRRIVDSLFNRIELSRNMSKFIAADPV